MGVLEELEGEGKRERERKTERPKGAFSISEENSPSVLWVAPDIMGSVALFALLPLPLMAASLHSLTSGPKRDSDCSRENQLLDKGPLPLSALA